MHHAYGREGNRYYSFRSRPSRDAWVSARPSRESLKASDVPQYLKFHRKDFATGATIEAGPELPTK